MLDQFVQWVIQLSDIAKKNGFDVNVTIHENYFAKICIDSDSYISQIVFWENNNLYEVEILSVESGETVFARSGEYIGNDSFTILFSEFMKILKLHV